MTLDDNPAAALRFSAMNALARREHSRTELERKLREKFPEHSELIAEVLDRLAAEGLQSDQRFAESFCRYRIGRGQGAIRILAELRGKGIPSGQAATALNALEQDWFELAQDVCQRRFGSVPATDAREQGKRYRFLQYRGFNQDQIRYALSGQTDE